MPWRNRANISDDGIQMMPRYAAHSMKPGIGSRANPVNGQNGRHFPWESGAESPAVTLEGSACIYGSREVGQCQPFQSGIGYVRPHKDLVTSPKVSGWSLPMHSTYLRRSVSKSHVIPTTFEVARSHSDLDFNSKAVHGTSTGIRMGDFATNSSSASHRPIGERPTKSSSANGRRLPGRCHHGIRTRP